MNARQLLKCKQDVMSALKAQHYVVVYQDACSMLQQARAEIAHDPLLMELLETLEHKVAQDQDQSSEEQDEDSSSSSDSCESCSAQSSAAECSCTPTAESDQEPEPGEVGPPDRQAHDILADAGKTYTAGDSSIQPAAASGASSHAYADHHNDNSPGIGNATLLQKGQQQQRSGEGQWVIAAHSSTHHSCTQQDMRPTAAAPAGSIQLAAGSCSLSHSQRADLKRQLAAGIEDHKTAAALEKALADDPLLSLSLG